MIGVNNQSHVLIAAFKLNILLEIFPLSSIIEGHKIKLIPVGLVSLGNFRSRIVTARHTFAQTRK